MMPSDHKNTETKMLRRGWSVDHCVCSLMVVKGGSQVDPLQSTFKLERKILVGCCDVYFCNKAPPCSITPLCSLHNVGECMGFNKFQQIKSL